MADFTDPTAQELDRQADGLKAKAANLRAEGRERILRAEALEEAAGLIWHRGYTLDRAAQQAAEPGSQGGSDDL